MKMKKIKEMTPGLSMILSIVTLIVLCILLSAADKKALAFQEKKQAAEAAALAKAEAEAKAAEAKTYRATFVAVGDNLYHGPLLEAGKSDSGAWNYDHIYEKVRDKISAADVAIVDQETVLTTDHSAVSSYPSFATPTEVGDALINVGFDVIESATNHVDDFGSEYIRQTLDYWKSSHPEATILGIHESQEDADTIKVREVNNIKVAFLNYCYGSNTDLLSESDSYMVDYFEKEKITADIAKAKEVSDCIIFIAQWGNEDNTIPSEYEKQWSQYLLSQGVDVLIGGHPHVLQPYETLKDENGNEMLVYYSLGNFVSRQQDAPELLGGMAEFTLEKTESNGESTVKVLSANLEPTVMHYNVDQNIFNVYFLKDYTDELASAHDIQQDAGFGRFSKESLQRLFDHIMSVPVEPSTRTDLLDLVYNANGTMTSADGTVLYDDEVSNLNPVDERGTLNAMKEILNGTQNTDTEN